MIHVKLFARVREASGQSDIAVDWQPGMKVSDLRNQLCKLDQHLAEALEGPILVAINHEMISTDADLREGDEVAFFPPVTGG